MRTLGQWLRAHRTQNGWTQTDLADLLAVANSTVSRWERDQGEPSLLEFRDCCLLFRASADAALGTGLGEITFAAKGGTQPSEVTDGDEKERLNPEAGDDGDREGAAGIGREGERGGGRGAGGREGGGRGGERGR